MTSAIPNATAAVSLLLLAAPAVAGPLSPAHVEAGPQRLMVLAAAFGDGPPTGPRHSRRTRGGDVAKPVEPYHADMNGATRENADKAYRKQYGF